MAPQPHPGSVPCWSLLRFPSKSHSPREGVRGWWALSKCWLREEGATLWGWHGRYLQMRKVPWRLGPRSPASEQ